LEKLVNAPNSPEKQVRRKQSESDNSSSRRRSLHSGSRVKSSYDLSSSSSGELSDVEFDIKSKMLMDATNNLEKMEALRMGRKLLRPEDYVRSLNIPSNSDSIDFNQSYVNKTNSPNLARGNFVEKFPVSIYCFTFFFAYFLFLIIVTKILLYIENIKALT
jgi:hypothetical protein